MRKDTNSLEILKTTREHLRQARTFAEYAELKRIVSARFENKKQYPNAELEKLDEQILAHINQQIVRLPNR